MEILVNKFSAKQLLLGLEVFQESEDITISFSCASSIKNEIAFYRKTENTYE